MLTEQQHVRLFLLSMEAPLLLKQSRFVIKLGWAQGMAERGKGNQTDFQDGLLSY